MSKDKTIQEQLNSDFLDAARSNKIEKAETLLISGADIHSVDYYGHTALMLAASRGHEEMIKFLLTAGSQINALDKRNFSVFDYSEKNIDLLLSDYQKKEAQMQRIFQTEVLVTEMQKILEESGKPNSKHLPKTLQKIASLLQEQFSSKKLSKLKDENYYVYVRDLIVDEFFKLDLQKIIEEKNSNDTSKNKTETSKSQREIFSEKVRETITKANMNPVNIADDLAKGLYNLFVEHYEIRSEKIEKLLKKEFPDLNKTQIEGFAQTFLFMGMNQQEINQKVDNLVIKKVAETLPPVFPNNIGEVIAGYSDVNEVKYELTSAVKTPSLLSKVFGKKQTSDDLTGKQTKGKKSIKTEEETKEPAKNNALEIFDDQMRESNDGFEDIEEILQFPEPSFPIASSSTDSFSATSSSNYSSSSTQKLRSPRPAMLESMPFATRTIQYSNDNLQNPTQSLVSHYTRSEAKDAVNAALEASKKDQAPATSISSAKTNDRPVEPDTSR